MEPNKPTPRRTFGTDASLSYEEQAEVARQASSMAITRVKTQMESAGPEELTELVRALVQLQNTIQKMTGGTGGAEPSDAELIRASKQ